MGFNGVGVSWVYVSIHYFGHTPLWLSVIATTAFVAFLSLIFFAIPFGFYRLFKLDRTAVLTFPAIWVLAEWSKTWFLSGFPWLWAGYGFVDTPLAPLGPITGVLGISFVAALTAVLLRQLVKRLNRRRGYTVLALIVIWGAGFALQQVRWVQPNAEPVLKVALAQGNIDQDKKWDPAYRDFILLTYKNLTEQAWDADIILWPEAAYPVFHHEAANFIGNLDIRATEKNVAVISGVPFWRWENERSTYYNSIFVIGDGDGMYHKQKLVPFGEYVPLEQLIRGLIPFFNLPMSSFTPGSDQQEPLVAKGLKFAAYICYEIVYPELVRKEATGKDFLVTISNDAWFGHSWGPLQHFQMARMRALETGKYLLRGTNTGVTAVIDPYGKVLGQLPQFSEGLLKGSFRTVSGTTPFMHWGWWPVLILSGLLVLVGMAMGLGPAQSPEDRPLFRT
jgi:apolipoprotein N-acyltransferase